MEPGKLRHRVQIQSATESRNSHGDVTRTWSTDSTVWASIGPLSGRELLFAQQVESRPTVRIRMRYISGLTASKRLRHIQTETDESTTVLGTYNIQSIQNLNERNHEIVCMCVEAE